jgi:hypothetical protein
MLIIDSDRAIGRGKSKVAPPGARPSSLGILQHRNAESGLPGYFKPDFSTASVGSGQSGSRRRMALAGRPVPVIRPDRLMPSHRKRVLLFHDAKARQGRGALEPPRARLDAGGFERRLKK